MTDTPNSLVPCGKESHEKHRHDQFGETNKFVCSSHKENQRNVYRRMIHYKLNSNRVFLLENTCARIEDFVKTEAQLKVGYFFSIITE